MGGGTVLLIVLCLKREDKTIEEIKRLLVAKSARKRTDELTSDRPQLQTP